MPESNRTMSSPYMQWAKSHSRARIHLASSGMANYPLSQLPVALSDLEITGDSYYGYPPLLAELSRRCGVPESMIFTSLGTSMANHLAMAATIERGDHVLVEHPTYELILRTAEYLGAVVDRFRRRPEDGYAIDPAEIAKAVNGRTKLIVLTNLHNPTSVLTEEATLSEVGRIAARTGAHVLVDEVYLDAAYRVNPRSSIHLGGQFIVTNSLTKVYGLSGLRCGWVLARPGIIQRLWHLNDLFYSIPSHPSELLSVIAFQNLEKIFERSKAILEANHRTIDSFFKDETRLACVRPGYGTVVFPKLLEGSVDKLAEVLERDYGTTIGQGRFFEMPQYVRIGLGIEPGLLTEGLGHLRTALDTITT